MPDLPIAQHASGPPRRCAECAGTGESRFGSRFRCSQCDGTGGPSRPPRRWLSRWYLNGQPAEADECLVITGLGPDGQRQVLFDALDDPNPAPRIYVDQGPDISILGHRSVLHYDLTGECGGSHPHVVWDPATPNLDELTSVVQALVVPAIDPDESWRPPPAAAGDFLSFEHPDLFPVLTVATIALWTAGASGQGSRAAMEWLAANQLGHMIEYCRPLAVQMGRGELPLISFAERILHGPPGELYRIVQAAWQALAPVEEAIRRSGGRATRFDMGAWVSGGTILAVSVPYNSAPAHRQLVVAIEVAAGHHPVTQRPWPPQPEMIWHEVPPPHLGGSGRFLRNHTRNRWLILVEDGGFDHWSRGSVTDSRADYPQWLIGPAAGPGATQAARARLGSVDLPPGNPGDALFMRSYWYPQEPPGAGYGRTVPTVLQRGPAAGVGSG